MGKLFCRYKTIIDDSGFYYCSATKQEGNDSGLGDDICEFCNGEDDEEEFDDDFIEEE